MSEVPSVIQPELKAALVAEGLVTETDPDPRAVTVWLKLTPDRQQAIVAQYLTPEAPESPEAPPESPEAPPESSPPPEAPESPEAPETGDGVTPHPADPTGGGD